jgi:NAD(P)-dependent dehydrogenase (short-subunit alcohol dehydrogenase family)
VNTVTPNTVGSPVGEDVEPANRKRNNVLGRGCQPEDVARAVLFLCSDDSGFITASEVLVDGGALHGAA